MSRARAKRLGLLPPHAAPDFELIRKPLWVPNIVVPATTIETVDPVADSSAAQDPIYHYQSYGGNYVRQPWHSNMRWSALNDYIAFKCYIKPHSINGRVLLFSQKAGINSGGFFVDMVDGKVRMGWYDSVQKREVWIGTDVPVVRAGRWHYICVRKRFPLATAGSGCWTDTILGRSPNSAHDLLIVREMATHSGTGVPDAGWWPTQPTWISKRVLITDIVGGSVAPRDCVSFTTDLEVSVAGCSAIGLVSRHDVTWTGDASGGAFATALISVGGGSSVSSHTNMLWQWSTANGKALDGNIYVVEGCLSNGQQLIMRDPITGATPDFSAYTAGSTGGVFTGVRLVKSDGFATAVNPDISSRDFELFGSHLSENPETGISPYVGEFASWAYVMANGASGANPDLFETGSALSDEAQIGTDGWQGSSFASPWDELRANSGAVHSAVDVQSYAGQNGASSTPNEKRTISQDANASTSSTSPRWANADRPIPPGRNYEVAVAFYDPEQADILPHSLPGPTRTVRVPPDDKSNPSGYTALRFYNLPISRDAGDIQRWIFLSEQFGGEKFLAARVPDNTSTDIVLSGLESERTRGQVLQLDNGVPPACRYVQATQGVLAYCGLDAAPDVIVWSKPFHVAAVPGRNIFQVPSGATQEIAGVVDFNGRLLAFKRDSVYRAILRDGVAAYDLLTKEMGCASHASILTLQNKLYWVGEQGLCLYTGAGLPMWVSSKLETFFNDVVDQGAADRISAALNRRRNQVVLSVRELDELYQSHRVTAEMALFEGSMEHRFGRHDDPGATVLASLRDKGGQTSRLIGGTDDGFAVWMDRADTALVMLGPTAAVWGTSTFTADAGATTTRIPFTGTPSVDTALAGMRGAKLRWGSVEALVLLAEANAFHLDRQLAAADVPASGTALTLGTRSRYWKTKWLDLGSPTSRSTLRHLDVIYTKEASGTVTVRAYEDFGTSSESVGLIDLTGPGWERIAVDRIKARFVQFEFVSSDPFELVELTVRLSDTDPR